VKTTKILILATGSITLTILLIFAGIWQTSNRLFKLFTIEPAIPQIDGATSVVDKIRGIQELATTVYTVQTIVPTSADRKLGEITLATTKLLYIARGEVRAGIDLSLLTDKDVNFNQNILEIDLPAPQILDSKIDVDRSRVYDYDRGFLGLGPDVAPQLQTLAQKQTLAEIVTTACNDGVLNTANERAKNAIAQLLTTSNFDRVQINTTESTSCSQSTNQRSIDADK
jgi:hypothetical protein